MLYKKWNDYLVYEDGKIFDILKNEFVKTYITNYGYEECWLTINEIKRRYKIHRLVGFTFVDGMSNENNIINHKDGNKLNNHYSNLEWCNYYHNNKHARDIGLNNISQSNKTRWENNKFREKTSKNISNGRKNKGSSKGKNNPMFRYTIFKDDIEISKEELAKILNRSISNINTLIRNQSLNNNVDIFNKNNITVIDVKKKS